MYFCKNKYFKKSDFLYIKSLQLPTIKTTTSSKNRNKKIKASNLFCLFLGPNIKYINDYNSLIIAVIHYNFININVLICLVIIRFNPTVYRDFVIDKLSVLLFFPQTDLYTYNTCTVDTPQHQFTDITDFLRKKFSCWTLHPPPINFWWNLLLFCWTWFVNTFSLPTSSFFLFPDWEPSTNVIGHIFVVPEMKTCL